MKNKEILEEFHSQLNTSNNLIKDLQILMEKNYCEFCSSPSKDHLKEFKKHIKIVKKAYTEIIKRKELGIR